MSNAFALVDEDEDLTWGMFAEVMQALVGAFGQLNPPQELQAYHDANLAVAEAIRNHARTRPSEDSFLWEYFAIAFEIFEAASEIEADTTKTLEEQDRLIEELEEQKLGEFFGPDYFTAVLSFEEARAELSEETLSLLGGAKCEISVQLTGDGDSFEEPENSLGTFSVGEAPRVGDYQVWVRSYSQDRFRESRVVVTIANVGERAVAIPNCDRHMSLQDQGGSEYRNTGCSWVRSYDGGDEIPPGRELTYTHIYRTPEDATGLVWRFSSDTVGVDFALDAAVDIADDHGDDIDSATAVTVEAVAQGALDHENDVDFFVFQAEEGKLYLIDMTLGTLFDSKLTLFDDDGRFLESKYDDGDFRAPRIIWEAPGSGSFYIEVSGDGWCDFSLCIGSYTLAVGVANIADDHGNSTLDATSVTVGEAAEGGLDYDGDSDFFRFTADAGQLYQIGVALGTLDDSEVVLLNSDGWELESNDDDGDSPASRVVWAAPDAGDYFVVVTSAWGSGTGTGSYTLTVSLFDIADDHADDIDGATTISVGGAAEGVINYDGDTDFFRFTADAGQLYQIDVALGTLDDSEVVLFNSDGWELEFNDDHGESKASQITWLAKESGDYYLRVSPAWDGSTGSYALTVNLGSATAISVGQAVEGVLEYDGDSDIYRFQAKAGQLYMLDVTLGTLSDSSMTLYDASGARMEHNDDYEDSTASRIFWEAPAAGDYYVEVEGGWEGGSYTLTVTEYVAEAAWRGNTDYDVDDDGFIEVSNLAQLNAIRWDLDGSGLPEHPPNNPLYAEAFPNAADRMGCPREECLGYELTADLDFDTNGNGIADAGDAYWKDGLGWDPIGWNSFIDGAFAGFFEGRGHTISNLYINRSDTDQVGLFGRVSFSGLNRWAVRGDIRHLGLLDVQVTGRSEVGGLVGSNGVSVAACYVTGSVTGDRQVGGLVASNFAGAVVASYSAASVMGDSEVGGLVGNNFGGNISASYVVGSVTGESGVGGLVGVNTFGSGTATDSYWDVDTSGQSESAGGEGKTTGELQSPTIYTGIYQNWNVDLGDNGSADGPWDFGTTGQYPTLRPPAPYGPAPAPTAGFRLVRMGASGLELDLAKTWEISDDGTQWTVYLRQNARFHDGSPVTAADVLASIQAWTERFDGLPDIAYHSQIDDFTLSIRFVEPAWDFMEKMSEVEIGNRSQ